MNVPPEHLKDLYTLFCSIETEREAEMLLRDLLTPAELDSIAERWQLIHQLSKGIPQRSIAQRLGVSICKITKGSRMMKYGTGGFMHFLKKMKKA